MNVTVENLKEEAPEKKLVGSVSYVLQSPWNQPEFLKEQSLEKGLRPLD